MTMGRRRDRRSELPGGEDGFILPAVVAVLLVVAAASAGAVKALQTRSSSTVDRTVGIKLQGIADGVTRLVAVSLVAQHARRLPGLGLPENGTPLACRMSQGVTVALSVQDQAGLIDINASPRPFLEDAFRVLGVPDSEAPALAAEIVDARDENEEPEPNGAEAPQYKARGLPFGPRNAPFDTVEEIGTLPSMTEATAARLRPFLTVYNAGGALDPTVTPGNAFAGNVLSQNLHQRAAASPHQAFAVSVTAFGPRGARAGRSAILTIGATGTGTGLVAWRLATDLSPTAGHHPVCTAILAALDQD